LFVGDGLTTFRLWNGIIQQTFKTDLVSGSLFSSSLMSVISGDEKLSEVVADAAFLANGVPVLVGGQHNGTARGAIRTTFGGVYRLSNSTQAGNFSFIPGTRGSRPDRPWPPAGVRVEFDHYAPCAAIGAAASEGGSVLTATLVFEMYDGTSTIGRRVLVSHNCSGTVQLLNMSVVLMQEVHDRAVTTYTDASIAEGTLVSTDSPSIRSVFATRYIPVSASHAFDATFPMHGPGVVLSPRPAQALPSSAHWAASLAYAFESFFVAEVVHDDEYPSATGPRGASSRYSKELDIMWRTLAPQVEQYPIAFAAVCTGGSESAGTAPVDGSTNYWCYDEAGTAGIFNTIDQAAEVGFELIKFQQNMNSTWRSFVGNEFESQANKTWFKNITDYARTKGIETGAYQLLRNARSAAAINQCAPDDAASNPLDGFDTMDFLPPYGTGGGCHNNNVSSCKGGSGCCSLCAATTFYDEMEATMLEWWDETGMVAVDQDGAETNTPCSNASHATCSTRRCWGSICSASRGEMPKKPGSKSHGASSCPAANT
jgi:hypothetical protein